MKIYYQNKYQKLDKQKQKGYSIGKSERSDYLQLKPHEKYPSPQDYDPIEVDKEEHESYSIGASKRDIRIFQNYPQRLTPSPIHYKKEQTDQYILQKSPKYTFGLKLSQKQNPLAFQLGPQYYSPQEGVVKPHPPNFQFGDKFEIRDSAFYDANQNNPDPSQYINSESSVIKEYSTRFAKEQRFNYNKQNTSTNSEISPATYQNEQTNTVLYSKDLKFKIEKRFSPFGSVKHPPSTAKYQNISPATYQLPVLGIDTKNGKSISPRRVKTSNQQNDNPSPDQYNTELSKNFVIKTSPKCVFGKQVRDELHSNQKKKTPGVGNYDLTFCNKEEASQFSFGSDKNLARMNLIPKKIPGVGEYEIQTKLIGKTKIVINTKGYGVTGDGGVFLDKDIVLNPSPSVYQPQYDKVLSTFPKFSFGSSERSPKSNLKMPGVGDYKITSRSLSPQFSFGSQKRFKDNVDSQNSKQGLLQSLLY